MMTTTRVSRSFPTLRYLAAPSRWLFGSRRRVWTAAAVLLAMIAAPVLWWSIQLLGLPDIGDPFDVEAFRASRIPDDRNAFVLYREAVDRLKPLIASSKAQEQAINLHDPWSQADPAVRRWVEENRAAMAHYRQGTERPDAMEPALATNPDPPSKLIQGFRSFQALGLLEASRLEEQGDMVGAWVWYRAVIRATYHLGLRGTVIARLIAQSRDGEIRRRLGNWAADPRTTPALIHGAIDDVVACGGFAPSETYTLKAEYSFVDLLLDNPYNPGRQALLARLEAGAESWGVLDSDQVRAIAAAWRFWRREPERSRRVIRLAIANWLAYHDRPPARRPAPDPGVSGRFAFYTFGPEAPANARALSPEALDRWLNTTADAQGVLGCWNLRALRARERVNHRAMVVLLASELYRRDHGDDPPSDEALVGPYLEILPDDGSGEAPRADASVEQE